MRTDAQISILGNLAGDLVLKQVQNNDVCNFTVAVSVAGKGEFLSHRTPLQGKEPGQ